MRTLTCFLVAGFAVQAQSPALKTFDTPDAAAQAAISAAEKNDTAALSAIFGAQSKAILSTGDPKQDEQERAEFAKVARTKYKIEKDPMNHHRVILVVGPEDWPFPVPILEANGKWSFNAAQGDLEVRARRIGANELDTIELCAGFVKAQEQYAAADQDKDGILEYADRIMSTTGKQDGLFDASSKAPFVSKGFAEAEVRSPGAKARPYHGYYFRILKAQGLNASSGAHEYVVRDKHMMGGYALVAWPAVYGVTGIRTFMVNQDGAVFEKDLGSRPAPARFDPDSTWRRVD